VLMLAAIGAFSGFGAGATPQPAGWGVSTMYLNVMETRVQYKGDLSDLSRMLTLVLADCLRGGVPSRLLAATIVPPGHAPVAVRLGGTAHSRNQHVGNLHKRDQRHDEVTE
jgi:hypothetical protein